MIEQVQLYGYEINYLPRSVVTMDDILGEDIKTIFQKVYKIEALMPDAGSFGGDQNIMSKFGFKYNATTDFMISRVRFLELGIPGYIRPLEGDLVWMGDQLQPPGTFPNIMFEINQVWYDQPGFQFGRQHIYKLSCETFVFSWERFRTGLKNIDDVEYVQGPSLASEDPGALNTPDASGNTPLSNESALLDSTTGNPFGNF